MGCLEQIAVNLVRAGMDSMAPSPRRRRGGSGCLVLLLSAMVGIPAIVRALL